MRINDRNQLGIGTTQTQGTGGVDAIDGRASRAAQRRAAEQDRTELSPLAQPLVETVTGQSPERVSRIGELKAAVAAGQYQADAAATGHGLVDDALAGGAGE